MTFPLSLLEYRLIRSELLQKGKVSTNFFALSVLLPIQLAVLHIFLRLLKILVLNKMRNEVGMICNNYFHYLGMSSLYSITVLTAIRCKSVVKYDNSWYITTPQKFLSSRWVQMIWGVSLLLAIPPIIGYGEFVVDVGMIK